MPRWRDLPEELDPQVREFTGQLRGLVDRSGMSVVAIADRTGYSKTSWERYLGGRLLPPQGAVEALAEATGADVGHLSTLWELAERAWSRAEMRHDVTMEAIRVDRARAALEEFAPPPVEKRNGRKPAKSNPAAFPSVRSTPGAPSTPSVQGVDVPAPEHPLVEPVPAASSPARLTPPAQPAAPTPPSPPEADEPGPPRPAERPRRRIALFAAGVVGTLLIVAGAVLVTSQGDGGEKRAQKPVKAPATTASRLPAGVKCSGDDCAGKDPEAMGCGGKYATTTANAMVGTAYVEVRYSKVCGAAWARIAQAAPGDQVQVSAPAKGGGTGRAERGTVDADGDAYTGMVTAGATARATACATLTGGQRGCTPQEGTADPSGGISERGE
ncbi:DUF2690 domain-containing protein [Streptomyces sp. NPDC059850]|uniref:helix-turn-helix domain-containing protein n=1 Tax=Streptomyces sp. NPDC059850 TaxID=3346970 RepID=UPI0036557AED